jgi:hypothetical protein
MDRLSNKDILSSLALPSHTYLLSSKKIVILQNELKNLKKSDTSLFSRKEALLLMSDKKLCKNGLIFKFENFLILYVNV